MKGLEERVSTYLFSFSFMPKPTTRCKNFRMLCFCTCHSYTIQHSHAKQTTLLCFAGLRNNIKLKNKL